VRLQSFGMYLFFGCHQRPFPSQFALRHNQGSEPNRHPGFARRGRFFVESANQKIGNPNEIQSELGLTKWAEVAVFKGFQPNELIFSTELALIQKEPYLLSIGFINWFAAFTRRSAAVYRSWLLRRASQTDRRFGACRLSQRSHPRLCL